MSTIKREFALIISCVSPEEAKRVVLRHAERSKVNQTWLTEKIGDSKQNVNHWFKGRRDPDDPTVWVRMAEALGVASVASSEFYEAAREFALEVLVRSDDQQLKDHAANLIREISKNYSSDR